MKKYFLYELKKNLLPLILLTVFACIIYLTGVLATDFSPYTYKYSVFEWDPILEYNRSIGEFTATRPQNDALLWIPMATLMVLCTIIPILLFHFKMNARQTDCLYSMPIKREKIYLVKSAVGLILVLVPYTLSFWLGFFATAMKENMFALIEFVPIYFIAIPLAILLFGFNAFIFTRANRITDGYQFIIFYACAAALLTTYAFTFVDYQYHYSYADSSYWFTYSPLTRLTSKYTGLISKREIISDYKLEWLLYLFAGVTGILAWAGLFLTAKKEKAENAERISDSIFGYRIMIPFYLTLALGFTGLFGFSYGLIAGVIFIISAISLFIMFRRSIKLKAADWISLAGATLFGIVLAIVTAIYG